MYLKSIEIQGFKSFANKIVLEFHNGITGIVGPNGSGKSNVADAVRWVLGEQSARQLRGGNMQDVIFSGTEIRKPLGFASVAITLDNADHKLDIDYGEVTVTRRLYRSGESEYLLNGTACRLRDIHELFYDTGIGKEGYSIIGQGQIDRILSGKPEERRELFDEAAGIVKFKRRKATTLRKLEEEESNLVRVSDILSELTRQLGPLEKQAETAKIYLKRKEELKALDINQFLAESAHIRSQSETMEANYQTAREELSATQASFDRTKEEYGRIEKELEDLEARIEETRTLGGDYAIRRQQMEGQIQILREQINTARQSGRHYEERLEAIGQEIARRRGDREKYEAERAGQQEKLREITQARNEKSGKLYAVQSQISLDSQKIEDAKNEIIEILNRRASTKGKMQRYDAMIEQIRIRKAELSGRLIKLEGEEKEQRGICEKQQAAWQDLSDRIAGGKARYQETEQQVVALRGELEEKNHQLESCQGAYHRDSSRLESLRNLAERYEGYGSSIRRVMEQRERQPGICGVVADLIVTDRQYETAIETALGGSIQNIVTDNEQTAKYMIEYLKRNRFGRATFLPLTNMRRSAFQAKAALAEPGVIGLADTLVRAEDRYRVLLSQLLGRTLVVDHIDHAIAIAGKYKHSLRIVTLEGDLLSPGGSMTGGAFKNSSNLLGRRREIEELERGVEKRRVEVAKIQSAITRVKEERNKLRGELADLAREQQKLELSLNTARLKVAQAQERMREIGKNKGQLESESAEITSQIDRIREASRDIQSEMDASDAAQKEQEELAAEYQRQLDGLQKEENEAAAALNEIQVSCAAYAQQIGFAGENIERLQNEERALETEREDLNASIRDSGEEAGRKEEEIRRITGEIADVVRLCGEAETTLADLQGQKEELNGKHKTFFEKRDELSAHINRMDRECFRLNGQLEKLAERKESLVGYLWEEYGVTPGAAENFRFAEPMERARMKREIAGIRDEIRNLGNVNVNAIEEYREVSERHAFLDGQHRDLVEAADSLRKIIAELDRGMRKQFSEKFAEIGAEFDRVFRQLFGGGRGTLELVEDEDILEAGVRIISQPPGKKLQNMMQLSGGEKALTAIALLFAIQNLKPSPFCLLDEIEAALDDSNVVRFAQYLHQLSESTQFIVITHRRGTMNAADRLYGITMQEKGVSTLVSVSLIENSLDQ